MRPKSSEFLRKSRKSFQKFLSKSEKLNRRIHSQIQDRTPTSRDINEFQNHHEKLSKIDNRELPSGSMYFLAFFEQIFFSTNHHESDLILVFHSLKTCTTTPSKSQPPSYGEKGNFFNESRNARGQKSTKTTTSEAGHSLSLTSENCNYMVASMGQTPAQVPLEVECDPTIGCRITLVKYEGAAMHNQCQKASKTTTKIKTKIKTITNKKGRENSKLPELPVGKCTEIAKKLHKKPKNS
jgi:hypothetical protein